MKASALFRLTRRSTWLPTAVAVLALLQIPAALAQQSAYPESKDPLGVRLCMTCHGAHGQGSPVVGGPDLAGIEPWYLRRQLQNFRSEVRGLQQDYIPGFEMRASVKNLTDADIEAIAATVSSWKPAVPASTLTGDAGKGEVLYQTCATCHGLQGEGNATLGAPALTGRSDWYLLRQLQLFKSGYRGTHADDTYGAQMQAVVGVLSTEADMQNVLAYINTL